MDNLIINMLNALGEGPVTPFADLLKSPEQHNSGLYSAAVTLHNTAVKPLTGIILAIVLIMMLASASTRIDGDRELGVRIISGIMLKAGLVVVRLAGAHDPSKPSMRSLRPSPPERWMPTSAAPSERLRSATRPERLGQDASTTDSSECSSSS